MKKSVAAIAAVLVLAGGSAYAMMDGHKGGASGGHMTSCVADCNAASEHEHQRHMNDRQQMHSGHSANHDVGYNSPSAHQHDGQGGSYPARGDERRPI